MRRDDDKPVNLFTQDKESGWLAFIVECILLPAACIALGVLIGILLANTGG